MLLPIHVITAIINLLRIKHNESKMTLSVNNYPIHGTISADRNDFQCQYRNKIRDQMSAAGSVPRAEYTFDLKMIYWL